MRQWWTLVALTTLCVAVLAAPGCVPHKWWDDDEEEVSLDEVPAAVKATLLKEAKGATIGEIEKGNENGKTVYEAEFKVDGKKVEIKIAEDGTVLEREVDD